MSNSLRDSPLPVTPSTAAMPHHGLWRRCRRTKLLGALTTDPDEARRSIEIDTVFAERAEWDACSERTEGGWDEIDLDGFILAERTIG